MKSMAKRFLETLNRSLVEASPHQNIKKSPLSKQKELQPSPSKKKLP